MRLVDLHLATLADPKGARNKKTLTMESLLEGQAEALTQAATSKALDVDSLVLRLFMDF